jgi:hypothetical protein
MMFQRLRAKVAQNIRDTPMPLRAIIPAAMILIGAHLAEDLVHRMAEQTIDAAGELDRLTEERDRYAETEGPEVIEGNVNKSIRTGMHDAAVKARATVLGWWGPGLDVDELVDALRDAVRRTTVNLSAGDVLHAESEVAGAARIYLAKLGVDPSRRDTVNEHA